MNLARLIDVEMFGEAIEQQRAAIGGKTRQLPLDGG